MFIEIEPNSTVPIYTQLINQIKKAIVKGELGVGQMLPSVRSLAGDLSVNMHTVNKAYNLLVEEGILVKSHKGYQVEMDKNISPDLEQDIKNRIEELLVDIYIHNVSDDEMSAWMQAAVNELKREWD